jgi:integrase
MAADKIGPAAVKIGIRLDPSQRVGFHNFRHSLATFLINKGKDVKTIQGLLRSAKRRARLLISIPKRLTRLSWRLRRTWLSQSRAIRLNPRNSSLPRSLDTSAYFL